MQFKAIGHVAIRVREIGPALDFYVGRLGFREMFRLDRDGRLWIVYLRITDSQFLEIFPDSRGEQPPSDAVGYNHLCLEVDDIAETVAALEAADVEIVRPTKLGVDGNLQAWIADPDGHRIEIMQMGPDSMQRKAIERLSAEALS